MEALWTAVFGEPPPIDAAPSLLAQLIIQCSAPPPVYADEVFVAAHLQRRPESTMVDKCLLLKTTPASGSQSG
jgi:hypothetical protein